MDNNDVWVVFTRSKPLPGCPIDIDESKYYFSEVFVPLPEGADWRQIAGIMVRVEQCLQESRLELIDVSKIIRYVENEWSEAVPMNAAIQALAEKSRVSEGVEISVFRSEEIEADCRYRHAVIELD